MTGALTVRTHQRLVGANQAIFKTHKTTNNRKSKIDSALTTVVAEVIGIISNITKPAATETPRLNQ